MTKGWGYVDMDPGRAYRRHRERLKMAGAVLVAVFIVIGACYMYAAQKAEEDAVRDEQQQCINKGGVVNEFNCRSTCNEYGGCKERCDWQCVRHRRVPAERD